ncbi:hypothetical protein APR40_05025 [Salegentibacter salarius]|uniref:Uncharacterized protein n=1 Tax=Salegentibacter salarius TaxID=435906 RepID=A0A2N0TNJ2_9FLAO|nr:hypothetical protein BHS39_05025 [Salegentibacter salarius]PKD16286.1 hypothetical protein APR40_05025 [Salegentibacter salarius]
MVLSFDIIKSKIILFQLKGKLVLIGITSRIKTVLASKRDCPKDDQALQVSTDFRFEKGLSMFL